MDTRADFQRLLEDMDKVIVSKRQELQELDERLESARNQLSEREAEELQRESNNLIQDDGTILKQQKSAQQVEELIKEQGQIYQQQLNQLSEELAELDSINQQLVEENRSLKQELSAARVSIEKMRARSMILNETLEEVKRANFDLNLRLARAESEANMQQKLLKKSSEQDELLLNAFNDKLESMKKAIESRDEEIKRFQSDNQFALETLGVTFNDSMEETSSTGLIDSNCKQRIIKIATTLREKDAQIELLKKRLQEATRDLENNAIILEKFSKLHQTDNMELDSSSFSFEKKLTGEELVAKCEMLENELEHKDKQLHLMEFRNRHFETILPNVIIELMNNLARSELVNCPEIIDKIEHLHKKLSEIFEFVTQSQKLLNSIEQLEHKISDKDAHIERLVNDLNRLYDVKINNDPSAQNLDIEAIKSATVNKPPMISVGQGHAAIKCQKDVRGGLGASNHRFTDEKIDDLHKDSLDKLDKTDSTNKLDEGSQENKIDKVRGEENKTDIKTTTTVNLGFKSILKRARHGQTVHSIDQYALDLQSRLEKLENENKLLESAMKEILLSIRWSDSKCSTILIDCPSLERLCQLVEARFLSQTITTTSDALPTKKTIRFEVDQTEDSQKTLRRPVTGQQDIKQSDLFQMIVMKSELDLLRGQNEQLRVDMKNLRCDYQKLLSDTKDIYLGSERHQKRPYEERSTNDQSSNQMVDVRKDDGNSIVEVECQTDQNIIVNDCKNCSRLNNLTNHLLGCITRIEERVNNSDRIYMNQLVGLYKLAQRLDKELSICENFLSEARRKYHDIRNEKMITDSRLEFVENQMVNHLKVCPVYRVTGSIGTHNSIPNDLQIFTTARNDRGDSIQSLTISKNGHKQRAELMKPTNSRVTINLLRSIIGCLQARLDYKDERLNQLEELLEDRNKTGQTNYRTESLTVPKWIEAH